VYNLCLQTVERRGDAMRGKSGVKQVRLF